jgi:hypothetical protein
MKLILEHPQPVEGNGRTYTARVFTELRDDVWEAHIGFVPKQEGEVLWSLRETVQGTRERVEHWATGLTDTFYAGALHRASLGLRSVPEREPARAPVQSDRVHSLQLVTLDILVAARLMGSADLVPGLTREVSSGGAIEYVGGSGPDADGAHTFEFRVQYGSPNAAAVFSNWLWSQLSGEPATLRIEGRPVEVHHTAIHDALTLDYPAPQSRPGS